MSLTSIIAGLALATGLQITEPAIQTPSQPVQVALSQWEAMEGDRFIVDTSRNIGYLTHTDGTFAMFRVGTGRRKTVYYMGRSYFAATPIRSWQANSLAIQGDRAIFGKSGRFLRLHIDAGKEETPYGIHSVGNIDDILASDDRYMSFGCILVNDATLDILMNVWETNQRSLEVITL